MEPTVEPTEDYVFPTYRMRVKLYRVTALTRYHLEDMVNNALDEVEREFGDDSAPNVHYVFMKETDKNLYEGLFAVHYMQKDEEPVPTP